MTTAMWVSGGVAVLPLYGLVAGLVSRVAKRHRWGHVPSQFNDGSGACPAREGGKCADRPYSEEPCEWWKLVGWTWPIALPLIATKAGIVALALLLARVFVVFVGAPAMRLYRFASGEEES